MISSSGCRFLGMFPPLGPTITLGPVWGAGHAHGVCFSQLGLTCSIRLGRGKL